MRQYEIMVYMSLNDFVNNRPYEQFIVMADNRNDAISKAAESNPAAYFINAKPIEQ